MTILLVADQQNSFATHAYVKKLARRLDKAGEQVKVLAEDLAEADKHLAKKAPRLVHLHYHPTSRKMRQVIRAAEALAIPIAVTYHEVLRVPADRRAHLQKCIERTRFAFFLTEPDRQAAIALNPRLADSSFTVRVPAPKAPDEEWLAAREAQWTAFHKAKTPDAAILACETIRPENGIERLLDLAREFPKPLRLLLAGTVPPGEGAYAKHVAARITYEKLPVEIHYSKRTLGDTQLDALIGQSLFVYHPAGNTLLPDYGGTTLHSQLVPYYNTLHAMVIGHPGHLSSHDVELAADLIERPADLVDAIRRWHSKPKLRQTHLTKAAEAAGSLTWNELAKRSIATYQLLAGTC